MRKPRILWVGEATYLNTGYGVYGKELLSRLHKTGKYVIAELAGYGSADNDLRFNIPWGYYPNLPISGSQEEAQAYTSNPNYQFGEWRFEDVCLHFRPDVVIGIRDHWMDAFIEYSPYRRCYNIILMPTVDSSPQQEQYLNTYKNVDTVLAYSEFGRDVLEEEGQGAIKVSEVVSAGVDLNVFKPVTDREKYRTNTGFLPDINIIGTVMRNQRRKLYPDLIEAFRKFIDTYEEFSQNTFLYIHTSYPDIGWDIPFLIRESKIGHRILFTYYCEKCKHVFPSFFQDARTACNNCGYAEAKLPNTRIGVTKEQLARITNWFDVYVQYSICLGKNEEILTKRGWQPISQVKIGDYAWTHKHRWRRVENVWKNLPKSHGKKVCKLSIHGDYETLIATENHEFPAYTENEIDSNGRSIRERFGDNIRKEQIIQSPGKYKLSELRKGDLLIYPIDDTVDDIHTIDISPYANDNDLILDSYVEISRNNTYPRYIDVDEKFCRFLGLFVGDGSSEKSNGMIKITANISDFACMNLAYQTMGKFGDKDCSLRKYPNRNACDVYLCSRLHKEAFLDWCKKGVEKQFPQWCMTLSLNKQKELLIGLFMADGHYVKHTNTSLYATISKPLADQLKHMLRRLRINYNVRLVDKNKYNKYDNYNRQPQYKFEIRGNIPEGEFDTERTNSRSVYLNNNHLVQIKSIEEIDYNDDVWCLTVNEDHTMTTRTCTNFQCEGLGMPMVEAAGCGVPVMAVDYSAMSSVIKNCKGYPIKVKTLFRDAATHSKRALPDNDDFIQQLYHFLKLPQSIKVKKGREAHNGAKKYYNWDTIAKKWEKYIDQFPTRDHQETWDLPPRLHDPVLNVPGNLNNEDLVKWGIINILGEPEKLNGYVALRMTRDLNYGFAIGNTGDLYYSEESFQNQQARYFDFGPNDVVNKLKAMGEHRNYWERRRVGMEETPMPMFLQLSKQSELEE